MSVPLSSRAPFTEFGDGGMPTLGEDNHSGRAATVIWFTDGSALRVNWDGRYKVANVAGEGPVTVYCPNGRRLHFPWHKIEMVEHVESRQG